MTNEEIFKLFLKKHKALMKFRKARKGHYTPSVSEKYVLYALNLAFIWAEHKSPKLPWVELNEKWEAMCKDLNLTGTVNIDKI